MLRFSQLTVLIASTAALQRAPLRNVAQRKAQNAAAPVREQQSTGLAENLENVLEPVGDVVVTAMRVGTCALMIHHGMNPSPAPLLRSIDCCHGKRLRTP